MNQVRYEVEMVFEHILMSVIDQLSKSSRP